MMSHVFLAASAATIGIVISLMLLRNYLVVIGGAYPFNTYQGLVYMLIPALIYVGVNYLAKHLVDKYPSPLAHIGALIASISSALFASTLLLVLAFMIGGVLPRLVPLVVLWAFAIAISGHSRHYVPPTSTLISDVALAIGLYAILKGLDIIYYLYTLPSFIYDIAQTVVYVLFLALLFFIAIWAISIVAKLKKLSEIVGSVEIYALMIAVIVGAIDAFSRYPFGGEPFTSFSIQIGYVLLTVMIIAIAYNVIKKLITQKEHQRVA